MSDFIFDDNTYTIYLRNAQDKNKRRLYKRNLFCGECEMTPHTHFLNHFEHEHEYCDNEYLTVEKSKENKRISSGKINRNYEGDLEQLTSNLINVISEAKKETSRNHAVCTVTTEDVLPVVNNHADLFHCPNDPSQANEFIVTNTEDSANNALFGTSSEKRTTATQQSTPPNWKVSSLTKTRQISTKRANHDNQVFEKDGNRRRKELHNKVEQRRRSLINDKIMELRSLLPSYVNRDACKRKGSILHESINYIKQLQKYIERYETLADRLQEAENKIKNMTKKFHEMDIRVSHSLNNRTHDVSNLTYIGGQNINRNDRILCVPKPHSYYHAPDSVQTDLPSTATTFSQIEDALDKQTGMCSLESFVTDACSPSLNNEDLEYYV